MNVRLALTLSHVDLTLKLSSELRDLMERPEQPDYLVKLRELTARMQAHQAAHYRPDPNPYVDHSCLNR